MTNLALVIAAMILVESGGNDRAVNSLGAVGPLQIRQAYVTDVNKISGRRYKHEDAFDRTKAVQMLVWYWSVYARDMYLEDMPRVHYRGPKAVDNTETRRYVAKVRQAAKRVKDEDVAWILALLQRMRVRVLTQSEYALTAGAGAS